MSDAYQAPLVASVAPPPEGWPKPLGKAGLQGLAGEIVRAIAPHTEADPIAIHVQFLAAYGAAVGRSPHFRVEADRHYANIFTVLIGESSKGRKGTSWGYVKRLMETADPEWLRARVQSGLSSGEGLIQAVGSQEEDYDGDDKRLLIVEPEFARLLRSAGRNGNTLSAHIRNAWDTGDLQVLTRRDPLRVSGAHVSLICHITRRELLKELTETESANGFANRFMFFCARRVRLLPEGGSLSDDEFESLGIKVRDSLRKARRIGLLEKSSEAKKLWHEVYPALSSESPGLVGAVTARSEAQTMRLAMLYALLDGSDVIEVHHLQAGLEVWNYANASAKYNFGDSIGNAFVDRVLALLLDNPLGLSRTELRNCFGKHRSTEIAESLKQLANKSLAVSKPNPTKGRPAEIWQATAHLGAGACDQSDISDERVHLNGTRQTSAEICRDRGVL